MILRKPYAFLIKQFKIIHIVLLFLAAYFLTQSNDIYVFFSSYISNGYSAIISSDFAETFVNFQLISLLIIFIALLVAIKVLLLYKHKKDKLYTLTIIYYILLFGYFIAYYLLFTYMESELISADTARLLKDISLLIYLPQYFFVMFFASRALGFNVKQFDFSKDLRDLNLSDEDNEEIEVNIEFDVFKAKRGLRRFIREMKYYYLENKLIFIAILFILIFVISYNSITSVSYFTNSHYDINENFTYKSLSLTITEAEITNIDQGGAVIKDGSYFLVVSVLVENNTSTEKQLDLNNLKILYNDSLMSSSNVYAEKFSDYGSSLLTTSIKSGASNTYVVVYEIAPEDISLDYTLKLYTSTYVQGGVTYPEYIIIDLDPTVLNEVIVSSNEIGDTLSFSSSNIGNSTLYIESYDINSVFYYESEKCIKEVCSSYTKSLYIDLSSSNKNNTLLKLTSELIIDDTTVYYLNNNNSSLFFDNFVSIKYLLNGEYFESEVTAVSTSTNDGAYYIYIPAAAANASELSLIINIRNREYVYILKG